MAKRWTKEEDTQLEEMLYKGKEYGEIAKLLGRTADAVRERSRVTGNTRTRAITQKMIDLNRIWRNTASDN